MRFCVSHRMVSREPCRMKLTPFPHVTFYTSYSVYMLAPSAILLIVDSIIFCIPVCYTARGACYQSDTKNTLHRTGFSPFLVKMRTATYFILCELRLRFTALFILTFWQHLQVSCGQLLQLFLYAWVVSSPCELIRGIALIGHFVHICPMFHQKWH